MLLNRITGAVFITLLIFTHAASLTEEEERLSDEIFKELKDIEDGAPAPRLFGMLEQIQMPNVFGYFTSATQMIKDSTICVTCRSVIDALIRYHSAHNSPEDLRNLVVSMCVQLQIQSTEVCEGVIDLNMDTVLYIINNTKDFSSYKVCGLVLQSSGCSMDPSLEWNVDFDFGKKPSPSKNKPKRAAGEDITILQLTDIHFDPTYTIGGNAECGQPMCCRKVQGQPPNPAAAAGYWGDYRNCDLSFHTFEDALQQITKSHKKIDYIYMTGDIVDHAVWDTSVEKNTDSIKKILARMKQQFPNTPVYPVLGNHEPSPLNVYAPTEIPDKTVSTNWLYELVAEEWSTWLPAETKKTILRGGFYTVQPRPGFRIIGLNNNVCYTFNWWQLYDAKDPYGQLKWLAETLLEAEKAGEKVHILGHVPSGDGSCQKTWSREYRKIIDRFESTVTAQFNGHTHKDEFEIFYSISEPTRAIGVAFNGGSVTQFENLNTNYKLYSTDSSSYEIIDGETWTYNLTSANSQGNNSAPEWFKLYSYKEDYGMASLSPTEFNSLARRMATDKNVLQKYARYFVKGADPALNCDNDCLKDKLCSLATCQVEDLTQCNILLELFQSGK